MIQRFHRFSYAISEISRCWHKIAAQEMEKVGLKGPHSVYLLTLYRHPEGITAVELGRLCGKDKADVSRMMAVMEEKNLVCREGNNYRAILKLTAEGMLAAEQVQKRAATAVEQGGKGMTEETREQFYKVLDLIVENLQRISQEGLPHESKDHC